MHIGHAIRIFRLQRQLTQEQLALDVNVATSNISRIENGLRQPSPRLLLSLANSLKTTPAALYAACEVSSLVGTDNEQSDQTADTYCSPLSPDVQMLLKLFHDLTPENQALLLEQAKLFRKWQRSNS